MYWLKLMIHAMTNVKLKIGSLDFAGADTKNTFFTYCLSLYRLWILLPYVEAPSRGESNRTQLETVRRKERKTAKLHQRKKLIGWTT